MNQQEIDQLKEDYRQDSLRRIDYFYCTGEYDKETYERMKKLFSLQTPNHEE